MWYDTCRPWTTRDDFCRNVHTCLYICFDKFSAFRAVRNLSPFYLAYVGTRGLCIVIYSQRGPGWTGRLFLSRKMRATFFRILPKRSDGPGLRRVLLDSGAASVSLSVPCVLPLRCFRVQRLEAKLHCFDELDQVSQCSLWSKHRDRVVVREPHATCQSNRVYIST